MKFYDAYFTVSRYSDGTWKVVLRQRMKQSNGTFLYMETAVDSALTRSEARLSANRAKVDKDLRYALSTNLGVKIRMYPRRMGRNA